MVVAAPLHVVEEADLPTPAVVEDSAPTAAVEDQAVLDNVDLGVAFYILSIFFVWISLVYFLMTLF